MNFASTGHPLVNLEVATKVVREMNGKKRKARQ